MGNEFKQHRIYEDLREQILSGKRMPGSCFPPEVILARELGIARNTLRPALARLEADGLVKRCKSVGTIICGKKPNHDKYLLIVNYSENLSDPYLYITPHIQAAAEIMNIDIEIINRNFLESVPEINGIGNMVKSGASGIFFLGNNLTGKEKICSMLKQTQLPVLLPHAAQSDHEVFPEFAVIRNDIRASFREALKFLADSGYRRMAFVMKQDSRIEEAKQIRGFSKAEYFQELEHAGFSTDPALFLSCKLDPLDIREKLKTLLQQSKTPDVILGYSDFYSMYVLQNLHSLGIAVPEQIGVMGLCGYPGGAYLSPPLTTVSYQYEQIGRKSMELMPELIARKASGDPMPEIMMPHSLIIRNSTLNQTGEVNLQRCGKKDFNTKPDLKSNHHTRHIRMK